MDSIRQLSFILAVTFISVMAIAVIGGVIPLALAYCYLVGSGITFCLYIKDKRAALVGLWRIREFYLHLVGMLFGWPGALIAQSTLRHKTRKVRFQIYSYLIAVLHMSILWVVYTGADYLVMSKLTEQLLSLLS